MRRHSPAQAGYPIAAQDDATSHRRCPGAGAPSLLWQPRNVMRKPTHEPRSTARPGRGQDRMRCFPEIVAP